jgi:hypothetical protein
MWNDMVEEERLMVMVWSGMDRHEVWCAVVWCAGRKKAKPVLENSCSL